MPSEPYRTVVLGRTHPRVRPAIGPRDEIKLYLPAMFRETEPFVSVGHASEDIVKAIESEHIDLVIVGARGVGRVKRMLLGSISEYLLAHAPCSVLIARHREKP